MRPRERLAQAARLIEPMQQGDLDSLCGLYATINAIRLALYPDRKLTQRQLSMLFECGLQELQHSRRLRETMLLGMTTPTWWRMSRTVVEAANQLTGYRLCLMTPPKSATATSKRAVRAITSVVHHGHPVLVGLQGRLNHWTVVVRYSPARLTFFDSADHHWVPRADLGLFSDGAPHGIIKRGIVILRPP